MDWQSGERQTAVYAGSTYKVSRIDVRFDTGMTTVTLLVPAGDPHLHELEHADFLRPVDLILMNGKHALVRECQCVASEGHDEWPVTVILAGRAEWAERGATVGRVLEYADAVYPVLRIDEHPEAGLTAVHILVPAIDRYLLVLETADFKHSLHVTLVVEGTRMPIKECQCVGNRQSGKRVIVILMGYREGQVTDGALVGL
jgi:hypothetical protein